jgi:hypothetical protein
VDKRNQFADVLLVGGVLREFFPEPPFIAERLAVEEDEEKERVWNRPIQPIRQRSIRRTRHSGCGSKAHRIEKFSTMNG